MGETLKKLCVKVSKNADLKSCLDKTLKPGLKIILDSYGVNMTSSAKKQELSDKAFETVTAEAENYLKTGENNAVELLKEICDGTKTYSSEKELETIKPLMTRGLVFLTAEGESIVPVVPSEIRDILGADKTVGSSESLEYALSHRDTHCKSRQSGQNRRTGRIDKICRSTFKYVRNVHLYAIKRSVGSQSQIWNVSCRYRQHIEKIRR